MFNLSLIKTNRVVCIIFFCTITILYTLSLASVSMSAAAPVVTDRTISDTVEDELVMDPAVESSQIDVSSSNGVVTLMGKVDNILAKERAANIARAIKGVKSVKNEILVVPPFLRSDQQIRDDVTDALLSDPVAKSYGIIVVVENNVVTLTGTVQTWTEKQLCEDIAKGIKGVKGVINNINVKWLGKRNDKEIKEEVEEVLNWDVSVDNGLIDVSVKDGKVRLKGAVGSAIEKVIATADSYVRGVTDVDNSGLKVEKWARYSGLRGNKYSKKTGKEIARAVENALQRDPRVSPFKINVEVDPDTHKVELRGKVNNLKAKRAAEISARKIVGVRAVDNRIKVRPDEAISDQRIVLKIRKVIDRDPYLYRLVIGVDVTNGVVRLYGDVDTAFEKSHAEDVASGVYGVIKVNNTMLVKNLSNTYLYDPWVNDTILYDYYWYQNMPAFPNKSDSEITKDIKSRFFWSPFVNGDQIKVKVDEGVATLTGSVGSWIEYNVAMKNAYKAGAIYVKNKLKIR